MTASSLVQRVLDLPEVDDWHPDMLEPVVRDPGEEARTRRARSASWRATLHAEVTSISPALVDMAAARGVDLARAARRLRPPVTWDAGAVLPAFPRWEDVWYKAPGPKRRHSPWGRRGRTPQAPRAAVVPPDHPDGPFAVALDGPALCGCARVGGAEFLTRGGQLQVWFERSLPDTIMTAAVGEISGRVVEHPVLTGRSYPIVAATRVRHWTVLEMETGLVPFVMGRQTPVADIDAGRRS